MTRQLGVTQMSLARSEIFDELDIRWWKGVHKPLVRRCCLHSLPTPLDGVRFIRYQTQSECDQPAAQMALDLEPLTKAIVFLL